MKFASLAAALSLAATVASAEQTAPRGYDELDALVIACPKNIPLMTCLQAMRDVSIQQKSPVLTVYTSETGTVTYLLVENNKATVIDPKDVIIEPADSAPAPAAPTI